MLEVPKVKWPDIGGLEDVKQQLQEAVIWIAVTCRELLRKWMEGWEKVFQALVASARP